MNRVGELLRRKDVLAGLVVAALLIGGISWWALGGDDTAEPVAAPSATARASAVLQRGTRATPWPAASRPGRA